MDLPGLGIKPGSPALQADSLPTELSGKPPQKGMLGLHGPEMQGTQVSFLLPADPTHLGASESACGTASEPTLESPQATAAEPASCSY